jgi:predicted hydrocarbon binding protein
MHGVVFTELKSFVTETYGEEAWQSILDSADTGTTIYLPTSRYPDEEALAIVAAASEATGVPVPDLLEAFGEYLADSLMTMYAAQIDDEWDVFDLLERIETQIHTVLRMQDDEIDPPELACERTGEEEVVIDYRSDRELCDLGRGLVAGVAEAYDRPLSVLERQCMHDGAGSCEMVVRPS